MYSQTHYINLADNIFASIVLLLRVRESCFASVLTPSVQPVQFRCHAEVNWLIFPFICELLLSTPRVMFDNTTHQSFPCQKTWQMKTCERAASHDLQNTGRLVVIKLTQWNVSALTLISNYCTPLLSYAERLGEESLWTLGAVHW